MTPDQALRHAKYLLVAERFRADGYFDVIDLIEVDDKISINNRIAIVLRTQYLDNFVYRIYFRWLTMTNQESKLQQELEALRRKCDEAIAACASETCAMAQKLAAVTAELAEYKADAEKWREYQRRRDNFDQEAI